MNQLLIAAALGAVAAAGITHLSVITSTDTDAGAASQEQSSLDHRPSPVTAHGADSIVDAASSSDLNPERFAQAEGLMVAGAERLAAHPTAHTSSGSRLANEPTVRSRSGVVDAAGVTVAAAVTNGHTSAHAFIRAVRYGSHDLGALAVHCRDGVLTAKRTGAVRLARNVTVSYGRANGDRIVGASVLVTGPGDRVIRLVEIAAVTCTSTSTGATSAPASSAATTSSLDTPSSDQAAPRRRLVPRSPARPSPDNRLPATEGW